MEEQDDKFVLITEIDSGFTQIQNEIIRDPKITKYEFWIYCYLLAVLLQLRYSDTGQIFFLEFFLGFLGFWF